MTRAREVTPALLRRLALPPLDHGGDKEARGRILAVGGSVQVPGAILLAGVAALRAGAGKLQLATVRAAALPLGLAVPEALVVGLPATAAGEIAGARAAAPLREHAARVDALLVGPGMTAPRSARALVAALVPRLRDDAVLVLDGAGLIALRDVPREEVEADAPEVARLAAARFGATVALKGAESWIAQPDGALLHYRGHAVGLGTSGSGDTLAGIVAGLAARGASATVAAAWGVWAHGSAGRILARRTGTVGYLARELLAEVPALVGRT
jgi:NAD(P)H-hydrate repair Nnr-like enzyme with NAD(P)H-hydrate dehydratase domain